MAEKDKPANSTLSQAMKRKLPVEEQVPTGKKVNVSPEERAAIDKEKKRTAALAEARRIKARRDWGDLESQASLDENFLRGFDGAAESMLSEIEELASTEPIEPEISFAEAFHRLMATRARIAAKNKKPAPVEEVEVEVEEPNVWENYARGAFQEAAEEAIEELDQRNVSPAVSPGLARLLESLYGGVSDLAVGDELAVYYPAPENVEVMTVPLMDESLFRNEKTSKGLKSSDKEVQMAQRMLLSGLTAILPLFDEVLKRGGEDEDLNASASSAVDGIKLIFYANTALVRHRRSALRPKMDRNLAKEGINAKIDNQVLFGESVAEKVQKMKDAQKALGVLIPEPKPKPALGFRGRGRGAQRGRGRGNRGRGYNPNQNQNAQAGRGGAQAGYFANRGGANRGMAHDSPLNKIHQNQQNPNNFNKKK